MKKIMMRLAVPALALALALGCGLFAGCAPEKTQEGGDAPWMEDGVLKILTIGNSFSDDTMEYVWNIADSLGVEDIYLGNLYIGGCTLDTHAFNARGNYTAYDYRVNTDGKWVTERARMGDALSAQEWDFVSLQQASGSSGMPDTYGELEYLLGYIGEKAPSAQIVWNMTWAYQQNSNHSEFWKYGRDQQTMYEKIVQTVQDLIVPNEKIAAVIPNGTAIQNARTSYVGDTLTRDGYHLTLDFGRYIAGLTLVRALTGLSVAECGFAPAGMSAEYRAIAVESAENAVKTPFSVTKSAYAEKEAFDPEGYKLLDLELTAFSYYNSDSAEWDTLITWASNGKNFFASKKFTREELPVGSVILIEAGWQYRPEGWEADASAHVRPGNVTAERVDVTEEWWGSYQTRAFNISKQTGESLEGQEEAAKNALKVYVPEEAKA